MNRRIDGSHPQHAGNVPSSKKKGDVPRDLVVRSELTAEAAKGGIHPARKAKGGLHQDRISSHPKKGPTEKKVGEIFSKHFSLTGVDRRKSKH
jgi:hypothetical protein